LTLTLPLVAAPVEDRDPDEADSYWSPEVMARSYEHGQRSGRRFAAVSFAAVICFDLAIASLVAGWVVAISLAAPQIIALIMILRRPLSLNPHITPKTPEEPTR
jgi:hypothetical protein